MVCKNNGRILSLKFVRYFLFLKTLDIQFLLHEFAERLNLLALSADVVAHGIEVVEELGECRLDGIWLAYVLVGIWVDNHLDAFFLQVNVYFSTAHHRVAVIVDDTWLATGDVELLATEGLDA